MKQLASKVDVITGGSSGSGFATPRLLMNSVINTLIKFGILKEDLYYHLIGAAMVIIFLFFGFQKWFEYEAQALIPYISNGPLIFGCIRFSASGVPLGFLGVSEWLICGLLFLGFWNKKLEILGTLGSCLRS
jgi:uncharacterized membrane protein YkgB